MSDTCKAVWNLQQVRDQILAGQWVQYDNRNDPSQLWAWGCNTSGQLGINNLLHRSSPTQIPGTNWVDISAGQSHALALKLDSSLWSWGLNTSGQLGDGTAINKSSPVQVPGTQWRDISTSSSSTLATKTDGTLWSWGSNSFGVLGDNTVIPKSSPVQIPGLEWSTISLGPTNSAVTKTDGTLWSWGNADAGRLGQGVLVHRSSPVQVPGTQWIDASGGNGTTLARKLDGSLWTWGVNNCGQLGLGNTINYCSPVQVPGTQWNAICAGSWLSMNTQGTRHLPHSHRNTMISCILYFDEHMSDQPMAPISFGQDGLDQVFRTFQFQFNVRERNQYNNNVLTIYPRTNTLIIFPGWLKHETEEAKSTVGRYCLGTNYFFQGESSTGYHNIHIDVK